MDQFAAEQNKKCKVYYSKGGQSLGSQGDAFIISWIQAMLYVYPLVPLIPRVFRKVKLDKASVTVIAPDWPRQYWLKEIRNL